MRKNIKIIITIILIACIIIPLSLVAYNNYQYDQEQKEFNKTIKEVSDIEKRGDVEFTVKSNNSTGTSNESISSYESMLKTNDQEIGMLQNLSQSTNNETLKNYTDLEIERLLSEKDIWNAEIDLTNSYEEYLNGNGNEITVITKSERILSDLADNNSNKKIQVENFLAKSPDLKNRLTNLGVEDDFMS